MADLGRKATLRDWEVDGVRDRRAGTSSRTRILGPCSSHTVLIHRPQRRGLWPQEASHSGQRGAASTSLPLQ